jgi:hypothetical protein
MSPAAQRRQRRRLRGVFAEMSQQLFVNGIAPMPDPRNDSRKAALLLHAMGPKDRDWLLAQLPTEQRGRLEALLAELDELGIPRDPALLREVAADASPAHAEPGEPLPATALGRLGIDGLIDTIEQADPSALARVLEEEPLGLVACLLSIREWRWTAAFLNQLDASRRRRLEEQLAEHRHESMSSLAGRSLREELLTRLVARLDESKRPWRVGSRRSQPARRSSFMDRWTARLHRRGTPAERTSPLGRLDR